MKLLLDQGMPLRAAAMLRGLGVDAMHTQELGMRLTNDVDVLAWAKAEGRIVVTLDADFHALLALSGADAPSVIRFRIVGLSGSEATRQIQTLLTHYDEDLQQGSVVTVQENRIRIRRLPLLPTAPP